MGACATPVACAGPKRAVRLRTPWATRDSKVGRRRARTNDLVRRPCRPARQRPASVDRRWTTTRQALDWARHKGDPGLFLCFGPPNHISHLSVPTPPTSLFSLVLALGHLQYLLLLSLSRFGSSRLSFSFHTHKHTPPLMYKARSKTHPDQRPLVAVNTHAFFDSQHVHIM